MLVTSNCTTAWLNYFLSSKKGPSSSSLKYPSTLHLSVTFSLCISLQDLLGAISVFPFLNHIELVGFNLAMFMTTCHLVPVDSLGRLQFWNLVAQDNNRFLVPFSRFFSLYLLMCGFFYKFFAKVTISSNRQCPHYTHAYHLKVITVQVCGVLIICLLIMHAVQCATGTQLEWGRWVKCHVSDVMYCIPFALLLLVFLLSITALVYACTC